MTTLETTQELPLRLTEDGTIRIVGSRVSLDSVIHHYKIGASAEQIAERFPGIELADVYATIAYYLAHVETLDEYLRQQETEGDRIQERIESDPKYQKESADFRARLLARKLDKKNGNP